MVSVERVNFISAIRYLVVATHQTTHLHMLVYPYRSNHIEPRCVKRGPKQYTLLKRPRSEFHKHLKILRLIA